MLQMRFAPLLCLVLLGCASPEAPRLVSANADRIVLSWFPGGEAADAAYIRADDHCGRTDRIALAGAMREGSRMMTREYLCEARPTRDREGVTFRAER